MIDRTYAGLNPVVYFPTAWIMLGIAILASGALFLTYPDDIGTKIFAMTLLALVSAASVRVDLAHPFVWFVPPFLLYSIAGPLLYYLNIHPLKMRSIYFIEELDFSFALDLHYLGLLACIFAIGPRRMSLDAVMDDERNDALFTGVTPVLLLAAALAGASVIAIVVGGFASKQDIVLHGSWATRFGFGFNIAATCIGVYLVRQFQTGRDKQTFVLIAAIAAVGILVVLYAGQRNFLFRFLIVATFAVHLAHHKLSFKTILPLGIAGAVLISVMAVFKNMLLVGTVADLGNLDVQTVLALPLQHAYLFGEVESPIVIYGKWLLLMALGSEFMTSGNNLALLLMRVPHEIPFQYGATLINDLVRAVTPGFLTIGSTSIEGAQNSVAVFNRLFFPDGFYRGFGQGFSFVGTGYFNFGIAGAIMIMMALGGAIRLFYRWAARSPIGLFFYIGFIPIAMFTARSDLGTPLSQGMKHVLVPLLLMLFIAALSTRRTPGLVRRIKIDRRAAETGPSRVSNRERRGRAGERRSRTERRLYPRMSRKDRGRFSEPPQGEPEGST